MKFKIGDASWFNRRMKNYKQKLEKKGFILTQIVDNNTPYINDDGDDDFYTTYHIEVNTLADLLKIIKITRNKLVLDEKEIKIYDDYIE